MQPRVLRWVVLFFTRPVHWSDAKAILGRLEPRERGRASAAAPAPAMLDEPVARPSRPVVRKATVPAAVASFDYSAQDMAVSEQPLDTLPAELQLELASMTAGRAPDRSPQRVVAEAAGSASE